MHSCNDTIVENDTQINEGGVLLTNILATFWLGHALQQLPRRNVQVRIQMYVIRITLECFVIFQVIRLVLDLSSYRWIVTTVLSSFVTGGLVVTKKNTTTTSVKAYHSTN